MKPLSRRRQRTFSLQICLPPLDKYAWEVVTSIERKTIKVVDPHNPNGLACERDSSGALLINSNATLPVPLADWLVVGCQKIRWAEAEDHLGDTVLGMYSTNADIAFGNEYSESTGLGPSAFIGQIILPLKIRDALSHCRTPEQTTLLVRMFQCIVAHELVHVFDTLTYLVPAFMDWRAFWRNTLREGCNNDILYSRLHDTSLCVDSYGEQNELESIRKWWPSRAESWFETRRHWSKILKHRHSDT